MLALQCPIGGPREVATSGSSFAVPCDGQKPMQQLREAKLAAWKEAALQCPTVGVGRCYFKYQEAPARKNDIAVPYCGQRPV